MTGRLKSRSLRNGISLAYPFLTFLFRTFYVNSCFCFYLYCAIKYFLPTVCVTRATIVGVTNGSVVDADTVISCVADNNAYPSASYRWINQVDGSVSVGSQFVLQPGTQYKLTCNASNDFDRPECFATDYVEFNSKSMSHLLCISSV